MTTGSIRNVVAKKPTYILFQETALEAIQIIFVELLFAINLENLEDFQENFSIFPRIILQKNFHSHT